MSLSVKPGTEWAAVYGRARAAVPEAFADDRVLNFWGGLWRQAGTPVPAVSPVDGTSVAGTLWLDAKKAAHAMRASLNEHRTWSVASLPERTTRVLAAVDEIAEHRELLSLLLMWELGKTWRAATRDVDECVHSVRWYADRLDGMLAGRAPLRGPVSNFGSWNHPLSVLMHAMLVQALAGNAAIAKTPAEGGAIGLSLAVALASRHGVPLTLVSGGGLELVPAMVHAEYLGCVSYLGGARSADATAACQVPSERPHVLEQSGINCWGVWGYSDWSRLYGQIRDSFVHAKQHSTAYTRYVVQRELLDEFLDAYETALDGVRFGNPLAVATPDDPLPDLDFGPLVSGSHAERLHRAVDDVLDAGATAIRRHSVDDGHLIPGQRTSAYVSPVAVLNPRSSSALYSSGPAGPVDSIVLVDTEDEFLSAMNVSEGALVASISCDDELTARRLAGELRAFKVGINQPRCRGAGDEPFGGCGDSWRGPYVGGDLLVRAVTSATRPGRVYGNFPSFSRTVPAPWNGRASGACP
ncbi:aldehyde dehydrogenase family protein [Haloechinothrix sp. YIM 98757]|uniref:Aldehyde dehydrogenase family protein n=1 Tax=Haloechinothrix aidingensis TaxID=2752311 RepID=A0A838AGY4_9PSEU|nr:aldehyde dehydrogenase family protein [Haloechinothrix aidingensis]MBA0128328.1 aldehyde dehydrogenase family protein [Haloechinothrix aidingensis]